METLACQVDHDILRLASEALEGRDLAAQLLRGISPLTEAFRRFSETTSLAADAFRKINVLGMEDMARQLRAWGERPFVSTGVLRTSRPGLTGDDSCPELGGYLVPPQYTERVSSFLRSKSYIRSTARDALEFSTNINEDVMDLDIKQAVREEIQRAVDRVTSDLFYGCVTAEQAIREVQDKPGEAALARIRQFNGFDRGHITHGTDGIVLAHDQLISLPIEFNTGWEPIWMPDSNYSLVNPREMTLFGMPVIESDLVPDGEFRIVFRPFL